MTENEMTNQAAQTMPERTYMTRDEALKIARACAYAKCHTHGYLPRTAKEAADWQPHEWVLDAIRWNAILQPVRVSEAGVPEGWVLVPARMELTPENMETLVFMLGGDPDAKDVDERWNGGTLWVGETIGDNGEKYYGLNVANVECYEEGSIPIVEFAAAPAASGVHPDALPDGTLSKSTAKRLAAASVSERARGYRHSTHNVHRGPESLPCYCTATIDHLIGEEVSNGEALARRFHEAYERLAPSFGYETRTETRKFDPTTPNGRLMIAVCSEITLEQALTQQRGESSRPGMSYWAVQMPGKMPKLYGAYAFAELNWYPDEGGALVRLQEVERIGEPTTPQPSADAVRELVKRWRECAKSAANGPMFDGASEYAVAGTYIDCADELESLLSAASGEKGVG